MDDHFTVIPFLRTFGYVAVGTAWVFFSVSTTQASAVDFTPFKGKYRGVFIVTANGGRMATSASTRVKVSRAGQAMTLAIAGPPILGGDNQVFPIAATLKFKPKQKLISNAFLMGFGGPLATRATKYKSKVNKFTFSQVAAPGALLLGNFPISGVMRYQLKFSKKKLSISGSGSVVTVDNNQNVSVPVLIQVSLKKRSKN